MKPVLVKQKANGLLMFPPVRDREREDGPPSILFSGYLVQVRMDRLRYDTTRVFSGGA